MLKSQVKVIEQDLYKCFLFSCQLTSFMCSISPQRFPALSTPPSVKDWSETSIPTDVCVGMIRRSMSKLEATLHEMIGKLAEGGMISFNVTTF